MKIDLDKYYTEIDLAKRLINITISILGIDNISEIIEPSAGSGSFSNNIDNCIAIDIDPKAPGILKQDFLTYSVPYKEGRLFIGNPPFGKGNYTSVKFFKNCVKMGDFIAFIQPISQLNNNQYMYEFDIIYSEDLGKVYYSDRKIHCCFNIYKRNERGINKKPSFDINGISIKGVSRGSSRNDKIPEVYDLSICAFGSSIGKEAKFEGEYCQQTYITIDNNIDDKVLIIDAIKKADWCKLYFYTATPKLTNWMIIKFIKNMRSIKIASYKDILQDCEPFGTCSVSLPNGLPLSEFGKKQQSAIIGIFKESGGIYNEKTGTFSFPKAKDLQEVEQILLKIKSENAPTSGDFVMTNEVADLVVKSLLYDPAEKDENIFIVVACAGDYESSIIKAILRLYPDSARIAYHSDEPIKLNFEELIIKPVQIPYEKFKKIFTSGERNLIQPQNYLVLFPDKIDLEAIFHAYNLLKHGGRLVTVISNKVPSSEYFPGFNKWLNDVTEYYKLIPIAGTDRSILTIDK